MQHPKSSKTSMHPQLGQYVPLFLFNFEIPGSLAMKMRHKHVYKANSL